MDRQPMRYDEQWQEGSWKVPGKQKDQVDLDGNE